MSTLKKDSLQLNLLQAYKEAFQEYLNGTSYWTNLNQLLDKLLKNTQSKYGFIGKRIITENGVLGLRLDAVTNIAWNKEVEKLVVPNKLIFTCDHGGLHVHAFVHKIPVVCNDPSNFPYRLGTGTPPGHPLLTSFLGIPLFFGSEIIGEVALANRVGGYSMDLVEELKPFCEMCAHLLELYQNCSLQEQEQASLSVKEVSMSILQSISEAVIVIDSKLEIQWINNAGKHIFGYQDISETKISNLQLPQLLPNMDWSPQLYEDRDKQFHMEGIRLETNAIRMDEQVFPVEAIITPFIYANNRLFAVIIHDITKEKQVAEKNQFLSFLSHDIRNPLQIISSEIYRITENQEETTLIKSAVDTLFKLVNDIIDINRIEYGKLILRNTIFHPADTIQHSIEKVNRYKKSNVEVNYMVDSDVPNELIADEGKIEQILCNLISNAFKNTPSGSVNIRCGIQESIKDNDCIVMFSVKDTGVGIKPEDMTKLFQMYTQLETPTHHNEKTGLGLCLVKTLCKAMGGMVNATSEYGKGSTFSFTVPCTIPILRNSNNELKRKLNDYSGLDGKSILVVDDNNAIRKVLCQMLKKHHCICTEAENGIQALNLFTKINVDFILLDCLMPGLDGYQTAKQLRKNGCTIPIIAVTGNSSSTEINKCYESGFDNVLVKPVTNTDLLNILSKYTDEKKCPKIIESVLTE